MSDVKWIKIKIDIFDDEKMYAIESMQDGLLIELIWFKLLCLAGKCNNHGFLMVNKKIPYTDDMLSKIFRMEIGSIQRALTAFQELEMIEVVDNAYMVSNWDKHQNEQGLEQIRASGRERTRKYRERQKNKALEEKERGCNVTSDVKCNVTSDVKCNVNRSISISNSISNSNSFLNSNNLKPTTHNSVELSRSVEQETYSQDSLNLKRGDEIMQELDDYIRMREQIGKKIVSAAAYQSILEELEELSGGNLEKKKRILKYAVAHSYSKLIDPEGKQGKGKSKQDVLDRWGLNECS